MDMTTASQQIKDLTVQRRRDLHRHPELGFKEFRTAKIVSDELNRLGFEVATGVGKTGVVGILDGGKPGPVILVRFDMDALPVTELTGVEYASEIEGVMHACGHDGHVAIGLSVMRLLSQNKDALHGKVKAVFQPAEEGLGGAEAMISDGVLENPRPDLALSMHLWNEKPVGWVGIKPGALMAGGDVFTIRITGRGGHGALPQQSVDPILAGAQVVTALQSIVSRNISPLSGAVVSVTQFHAGEAFNVIPPEAMLNGTLRSFDPQVRQLVISRLEQISKGVAAGMGCDAKIEIKEVTPAVINDPGIADRLQRMLAQDYPDLKNDGSYQTMVSEDMAYILREIPGVYIMVGSANEERGLKYGHHHPRFDFDENALVVGTGVMTSAIMELLGA